MSDSTSLLQSQLSSREGNSASKSYGSLSGGAENQATTSNSLPSEEPISNREMDDTKTTLKLFEKIGFSLGHVYNDLCAGVWFSYTLLFMQGVLQMPGPRAGALVMLGQVGDAIATPIVGVLTDRFSTKRKWHIFGTFLVFLTFPLIFAVCPFCDVLPVWWKPTYFSIVILIFQFGWPVVQITHLAMIPELSRTQRDRSDLTATRYSASICSNVVVYIVTWIVLRLQTSYNNKITPQDYPKFRDIALILTVIGLSMSVLFHFALSLSNYESRRRLTVQQRSQPINADTEALIDNQTEPGTSTFDPDDDKTIKEIVVAIIPKKNFLKSPLLYQNALLYVFSRLFMTTSLVYMPLWLNERSLTPTPSPGNQLLYPYMELEAGDRTIEHIATVPLMSFISSFVASMILKMVNRRIGHKVAYLIGSITSIMGCLWVAEAASPDGSTIQLYLIAILFGAGSSVTMISSLCITADMIGPHADQGGFIYSAVTFCDKLITGIAVVIIETIKCEKQEDCPTYYRNVLAYACGVSAIMGILTLCTLIFTKTVIRSTTRISPAHDQ